MIVYLHMLFIFSQEIYNDAEFHYYKVPIPAGTSLSEGTVADLCGNIGNGLSAVCFGGSSCQWADPNRCVVTPLSTRSNSCNNGNPL